MNLSKLAQARTFLLDMDGTFYIDDNLLPGAVDFLTLIAKYNLNYLFLTNNSSRSALQYGEKLRRLGLPVPDDHIFTSGQATAIYLSNLYPGARVSLFGTPALEEEFRLYDFQLVSDHPELIVLGFDTTLTYQKLWDLCTLVRQGLPYIATHPDINCPATGGFMPDIGSIIAFVETSTGRHPDIIIGKPYPPIIQAIERKTDLPAPALCMVGDRLYTDIALGKAGITTVLVLTGETGRDDLEESPFHPDIIVENLIELADSLKTIYNYAK